MNPILIQTYCAHPFGGCQVCCHEMLTRHDGPRDKTDHEVVTQKMVGVFHLPRNSGNSGWDVNGTHVFGSLHWNISGINGTSEKVVLFSRWKLSDGNVCSIYNF